MQTELEETQNFFKNHNFLSSIEWLQCCIEWCKENDLPPNYTIGQLQKMCYQQWLILDLRVMEVALLPRNLSNEKKYCLTGNYGLQMMQVVDISKPKLWQLQRIRNNVAKNTEAEKDFGKRVLQLTLTDGVQEIQAMEYEPIPCLNINLLPGTKIKLIGPIMIRNGRLMLKEENVKVLGGKVDELRVEFAAENVLARALKLEENPNPYTIDEKALEVPEANTTTQMDRTASTRNYTQQGNQNQQVQPRNNPSVHQNVTVRKNIPRPQTTTNRPNITQEIPPEYQVDDDLLRELEEDFEGNSVKNTIKPETNPQPNEKNRCRGGSSPDLFGEIDEELLNEHLDEIDADHMTSNLRSTVMSGYHSGMTRRVGSDVSSSRNAVLSSPETLDKNTEVVQDLEISSSSVLKTKPEEVISLDDSFEDIDIDLHLDNIDEELANLPSSTQIRNDFKDRLKSPELKSRKIADVDSTTLKKPLKKLTQGTVNFESSHRQHLNLPSSLNINLMQAEDINPFSIFKKPPQNQTSCRGATSSAVLKTSSNSPQNRLSFSSSELISKHLPSTSKLPQDSGSLDRRELSSVHCPDVPLASPPSSRVMPIEKLKKMLPNIGKGKFKIKAKFNGVVEKLQQVDDHYYFVIAVKDDTGDLTVQIHTDIVTDIVKVTAEELAELRVISVELQTAEVKRKIVQVMRRLYDRVLKFDNIFEVQVTRGEKHPIVINIF